MASLQEFLDFSDFAERLASNGLMLFHTTSNEHFIEILEKKSIQPIACRHFNGEKLAYFFLGRPAYKLKIAQSPSYWQLPSVFVFRKFDHPKPVRIFPFDSGAMSDGRYAGAIGINDLNRFHINDFDESIDRFMSIYYKSIEDYRSGIARASQDVANIVGDNTRFVEALAVAKLLNYQYNDEFDDRSKVVEIQVASEISFLDNPPVAIICCKEWLRDPLIRKAIDEIGAKSLEYPIYPLNSSSYYSKIYEMCESL